MRCGEEWRERGLGVLFECEEESGEQEMTCLRAQGWREG